MSQKLAIINMIGLLLQIHWLAVNGRTEVLHDLFAFVPDVDVEVWLYQRERKKRRERKERERGEGLGKRDRRKRRERYEEGRAIACFKIMDIRPRDILTITVGCTCIYELKFSS